MSQLQKILEKYPNCYYHEDTDTICIDINEEPKTIEEDAKWLIENHFEGETIETNDETCVLTGEEYVKHVGGLVEAFKELGIQTW